MGMRYEVWGGGYECPEGFPVTQHIHYRIQNGKVQYQLVIFETGFSTNQVLWLVTGC